MVDCRNVNNLIEIIKGKVMKDSNLDVNLFFDESGKSDMYCLMGALLIPDNIYNLPDFKKLNEFIQEGARKKAEYDSLKKILKESEELEVEKEKMLLEKIEILKQEKFELHFTDYDSSNFERFLETIKVFAKYSQYCEMNIINYFCPENSNKEKFKEMSYRKFPERVFYGLLRNKGKFININAKIFIEFATEYKSVELKENIGKSLNDQAIYRGEKFKIKSCEYKSKGQELGLELTDIILGVLRNIILYLNGSRSKTIKKKINLINECLKIDEFYTFLSNIKLYEWNNSSNLKEVKFNDYLRTYILKSSFDDNKFIDSGQAIDTTVFEKEIIVKNT